MENPIFFIGFLKKSESDPKIRRIAIHNIFIFVLYTCNYLYGHNHPYIKMYQIVSIHKMHKMNLSSDALLF